MICLTSALSPTANPYAALQGKPRLKQNVGLLLAAERTFSEQAMTG